MPNIFPENYLHLCKPWKFCTEMILAFDTKCTVERVVENSFGQSYWPREVAPDLMGIIKGFFGV